MRLTISTTRCYGKDIRCGDMCSIGSEDVLVRKGWPKQVGKFLGYNAEFSIARWPSA
jgi:hypothetical protein